MQQLIKLILAQWFPANDGKISEMLSINFKPGKKVLGIFMNCFAFNTIKANGYNF